MPGWKLLVKICLFSAAVDTVFLIYKFLRKKRQSVASVKKMGNVHFFSDRNGGCLAERPHDYNKCPLYDCPVRNERKVTQVLLSATSTLDLCLYTISHDTLIKTIEALIDKRVKIRIVTDANKANRNESSLSKLRSKGAFVCEKACEPTIDVPFPVTELHMHHKFAIADGTTIITGSVNWTNNSFKTNWDHLIVSSDPSIVKPFQKEFEFLFGEGNATAVEGVRSVETQSDPIQVLTFSKLLQSPEFKVVFFRREGLACRPHINKKRPCERQAMCSYTLFQAFLNVLGSASYSLDMCLNQFTLEDYSSVVIQLHQKGVNVRLICDRQMASGSGSQVQALIDAGIEVRMRSTNGTMHNKWFILDKKVVAFGSLNWTMQSFCGNYENVALSSAQDIVAEFTKHFNDMWNCFIPASKVLWGNRAECRQFVPHT